MDDDVVPIPDHLTIRVTHTDDPVSAVAGLEAWESRARYPDLLMMPPVFGSIERTPEGAWRILCFHASTPQGARDDLGHVFRCWAHGEPGGRWAAPWDITDAERAAYTAAYERLEWEKLDELAVAGRQYRVFRAEQVLRGGPEGVEPPRPTDPDPAPVGRGHRAPSRIDGFVIDPAATVSLVDGIVRLDLSTLVPSGPWVTDDVREDAARASARHPNVFVLPVHCAVAEQRDGRWGPMTGACESPQAARDTLAAYLREFAPMSDPGLGEEELAAYAAAADRLDALRANTVEAAGRRFQLVRVEPVVRLGPDGPERPRPSDPDPDPPIMVQAARDRAAGQAPEAGPDEDEPDDGQRDEDQPG